MNTEQFLNYKIHQIVGKDVIEGKLFGIELELEGRNVGLPDVATKGWKRDHDGSLRGEAIEYTTMGGKTLDEARALISELFGKFARHNVKINSSIRTSTHVHLNFSDKKVKQAINFFCLFTMLEEVLQYYSGEDRKGNLFCVSSREADGIIRVLSNSLANGNLAMFVGDKYKYAACNLCTLYKFGTVEIRTMQGASSAEQVIKWVEILSDLYNYALDMISPAKLVEDLSLFGAEGLMRRIFSDENRRELMRTFPGIATLHYSLMEGARLIQLFAFQYDEAFKAEVQLPEPGVKKAAKINPIGGMEPFGGANPPVPRDVVAPRGGLPVKLADGRRYCVYLPDGTPWNCFSEIEDADFFANGDRLDDRRDVYWSSRFMRFVYNNRERVIPLRWLTHHIIEDEGPPAERIEIPAIEEEEDWDVPDEEVNEEDF